MNLPQKLECTFSPAERTCIANDALSILAAYPKCRVYMSMTGVAFSTGSAVVYDTIESDSLGMYDPTTGIFTIPEDGVYNVTAQWTAATGVPVSNSTFGMAVSAPPYPIIDAAQLFTASLQPSGPTTTLPSMDTILERTFSAGDQFATVLTSTTIPISIAGTLAPLVSSPPGVTYASVRRVA